MLSLKEAMEKYNEEIDKLRGRYGNFFGFYDIYRNELHCCTILLEHCRKLYEEEFPHCSKKFTKLESIYAFHSSYYQTGAVSRFKSHR